MDQARKEQFAKPIIADPAGITLIVAFAVSLLQDGGDWEKFKVGSQQVWTRALLCGDGTAHTAYHKSPWLDVVLSSPSIVYILLHGQVDRLVLDGMLLSQGWWILVGLTKSQVTVGLIFGIPRTRLLRAIALVAVFPLLSFLWFGSWPPGLIRQPHPPAGSAQFVGWTMALPCSSRRHLSSVSR